jgi:glycosyltransferase involved in cell wall biosynthesis
MSADPRLSVLIPVHDAEPFVHDAITSILGQTFSDFEVIVVDDRSTDGSLDTVRELAAQDPRICVVALVEQRGVAGALNAGLAKASAPLLARMDADDVSHPERFAVQVAEMDRDPDLGVLGSQIRIIGLAGEPEEPLPWHLPCTHDETVWRLFYGAPICHPTVVMRTEVVRDLGGYDPTFPNEDTELWTRMAFATRMRNLDAVLLAYRMPPAVHVVKKASFPAQTVRVTQPYLERIVGVPVAQPVVRAICGVDDADPDHDAFDALTAFTASSLLVRCFEQMQGLGMFVGDGLQRVVELMGAHLQELAGGAHVHGAGRV